MRRILLLAALAIFAAAVVVTPGAAHFRRHCRPCPCPCPVFLVYPPFPVTAPPTEFFRSPKGNVYRITVSREPAFAFERRTPLPLEAARAGPDDYIGHDRKAAKTSIATGPHKSYAALGELLDELQQQAPDQAMLSHDPPITRDPDSARVAEEDRNVTVPAWLYAAKKEANDNDFHLIIGTDPRAAPVRYMNSEISGLPAGGPARAALRVPRQAFKDFLGERQESVGTVGYLRFEDPVPVRVTGSLFYDVDHLPGVVGSFTPPQRVPATAWEIHPITEIVFEP
jgi:hypothetical protein